jgi:arylsulfatase A-like enzyme
MNQIAGIFLAIGAVLAASPCPAADTPRKPNVVFLLADQWRAQALACDGDINARTPQIDRLAAEGVRLTTAVSTCPVCSPYRACFVTGRYPTTHGVFLNDVCLNHEAVSLADAFSKAGYRTAWIGKWHLDGHGRTGFIPPERRQGFEFWRACECTHAYNHSLYYGDTDKKRVWAGYDALAQTDEACAYIRGHRQEPFLLVLSWGPPHNPYETAPAEFQKLFEPERIKLRPNVPEQSAAAARRDLAGYYAHCAALDECVGRVRRAISESGLAGDTLVVFTSDHGDMLGSHGEVRKQRPWDEAICVPMVMSGPKVLGPAGRTLAAPLGTPDIMPTLLGLCGVDVPATVEGENRAAWLRGEQPDADRAALIACVSPFGEWTRPRGGREYRGLRTVRYTYVRSLDGPWLLYDNQADPYQQQNLVGDPKFDSLRADLDSQLTRQLQRCHDEFLPGQEYVKKWGYVTDSHGTVPYKQ